VVRLEEKHRGGWGRPVGGGEQKHEVSAYEKKKKDGTPGNLLRGKKKHGIMPRIKVGGAQVLSSGKTGIRVTRRGNIGRNGSCPRRPHQRKKEKKPGAIHLQTGRGETQEKQQLNWEEKE